MSSQETDSNQLVPQEQTIPKEGKKDRKKTSHLGPDIFPPFVQKILRLILNPYLLAGILFVAALLFRLLGPFAIGTSAGVAMGSLHGITTGLAEGAIAGKEEGLSAKDIESEIGNVMESTAKLQVLLIDLNLSDIYTQGDKYAALLNLEGEATFTVDLTQSAVSYKKEKNEVKIEIPTPELEFYLDDSATEIIAEYPENQNHLFNGSATDGYAGYLNSRKQINDKIKAEMLGYDEAVKQANDAALRQVELLARSICGSGMSVKIDFINLDEG